jgi:hypothetical protein
MRAIPSAISQHKSLLRALAEAKNAIRVIYWGAMIRGSILAAVALLALSVARAAELEGVPMPDVRVVDGTLMRLNGIGLRTFSVLGIRIYVAGLYLERRNGDANTILHSRERKLLDIRFLRDVGAEDARKAWRESFQQNLPRSARHAAFPGSGPFRAQWG